MMKTLLMQALLLSGLSNTGSVSGAAVQSPLRFRFDTNKIKDIVHLRDQEVFRAFKHVELKDGLKHLSEVKFSLLPITNHKWGFDFDLDVHFSKEYFGAESDKVTVKGTAKLADGTAVDFTAPVPLVKWQFAQETVHDEHFKVDRLEYKEKEWLFKTGAVEGKGLTSEAKAEIATAIDNHVTKSKDTFEVTKLTGELDPMRYYPMESMVHMGIGRILTNFSQSVEFNENYMEFGFGLDKFKLMTDKQTNALKEIKQDFFNEKNKDGQEALMQLSIDDNLFQSIASVLTSIEKTFKLRPILEKFDQTAPHVHHLNTGILGKLFPSFAEKYGEDAPVDVILSPSHSLFKKGVPNAKMSGIQMDKKGNFKVTLNVPITILVENKDKVWEEARHVYVTAVFKFKIGVNDKFPKFKKFNITPKDLEVTSLKVLNDGQEEEMEEMMIQSIINIQLENLKNKFEDIPFLKRLILKGIPKQVDCFGFNYADLDISFKKSMLVFSVYQQKNQYPFIYQFSEFCSSYWKDLRDVLSHTYVHIENFLGDDTVINYVKIAQEYLAEGSTTFNPLDGILSKVEGYSAEVKQWRETYAAQEVELQRQLDIRVEYARPVRSNKTSDATASVTESAPSDTMAGAASEEVCKDSDTKECQKNKEEQPMVHDDL